MDFDFSDVMIDGKYIINYSLVDNATGEVLGTAYQTGDGGTFGSFSNLQGDGFEEAAEAFKKFLISCPVNRSKYKQKPRAMQACLQLPRRNRLYGACQITQKPSVAYDLQQTI